MTTTESLVCWKCGSSIAELPIPLARLAECLSCRAYLHVCRMCEFYDPRAAKSCREPVADEVQDKERANFCGYFQVRPAAYHRRDGTATQSAQVQLDALFGNASGATPSPSEPDAARAALERLFGTDKKSDD